MYLCICNEITEEDLKNNPDLSQLIGTVCGRCISDVGEMDSTGYNNTIENRQGESRKN